MANPFQNATPKRLNPRGHRALTQDEVKTIMSAATGELQVLLALGVFCGFRIGDACLLRWSEVDSERDLISHVPSKTRSRKNKPVHIPIHADLKELLEKTPRQADSEYVLPTAANSYIKDGGCSVSAQVRRLFQDCGLIPKPERKGKASKAPGQQGARPRRSPEVSFHSLRHTFVSQCARAGVSLPVVRELAGHHSEAVQRVYLHVSEAETRNAVASLPSVLSPVAPPPVEAARKRAAEYLASASEESVWFVLKYLEDRRAAPLPESAGKDKVPSASPAAVTETPEAGE